MRIRPSRRRPSRLDPVELDATVDALARNHVAAWHAERGAATIPVRVLGNARVRRAYGLEGDVAPESEPPDEADLFELVCDDDDEPQSPATKRRIQRDRARIAEHWRVRGTCERVPWASGHVGRAIRLAGRTLGLTRIDAEILQLVIASTVSSGVRALLGAVRIYRREDLVEVVASALARRPREVGPRLAPVAPLLGTGLVQLDAQSGPYPGWELRADPRLVTLVLERGLRREKLLARFLAAEPAPTLGLEDFAHLRGELEALRRVLDAALASRERGVNFLLYGPTGVGKTMLVRALARAVGADLYGTGAANEDGESLTPQQRLASLRVGHRMLAAARAVVVFDELEDLDAHRHHGHDDRSRPFGKLWMNRLLEETPTPTFWIANSLDEVDPAYLRRFTFALRCPSLGAPQRRRVWARVGARDLAEAELDELASAYDVSPGEIASATRAARAAGGGKVDREVLDRILAGAVRVMGRRPAAAVRAGADYRPEVVNASVDLVRLADRLCAFRTGRGAGVSLCLYGRPATGKSEWVHHLARRAGRPLVVRRVSDLESMWVGEAEQNLARAFEEAAQQDGILLLDECDWLLGDRRRAHHSWERSRVDEMLQQLEAFTGIVACTTNLFRDLDQAALRRFVHKVEFLPLRPDQALLAWDAHLAPLVPGHGASAREAAAAALRRVRGLTPGDFGVVARRAAQLGGEWTAEALLRELELEVAARGHDGARLIGF